MELAEGPCLPPPVGSGVDRAMGPPLPSAGGGIWRSEAEGMVITQTLPPARWTPQLGANWGGTGGQTWCSFRTAPRLWVGVSPLPGVSPPSYPLPLVAISQFKKENLGRVAFSFISLPSSQHGRPRSSHPLLGTPLTGSRSGTTAGTVCGMGTGVSHTGIVKDNSFLGETDKNPFIRSLPQSPLWNMGCLTCTRWSHPSWLYNTRSMPYPRCVPAAEGSRMVFRIDVQALGAAFQNLL